MPRLARFALVIIALLVVSRPGLSDDPKAPLAKLELKDGDSIVFLGDSITHQRLYTQYVEDYFYTRMPQIRLTLHNAGVGGAKAWDALQRFDKDVAAYKPKYVTILLGMNDGSYQPFNQGIFDTYRNDMTAVLAKIQEIGATPIPMTPTMFDARARRVGPRPGDAESTALYNSVLTYYGTWLRETSVEQGFGFVDMWGPLNNITLERRKTEPGFTLIKDAVHPDAPGQVVMAVALITDLGLPRQVSNIRITPGPKGEPTVRTTGGKLTDLKFIEDGMEFTWQADSLPWVVPEEARLGAELTHLGHRLGREALEIHNLPAGRFTLTIDGVDVGTYTAEALARHIELQVNDKTPQYQQALAVAQLNKERNEKSIGALRAEWLKFQSYARSKRDAEANPDNAQLQAKLAEEEQKIVGMDERVTQANAAAKEIEDRIFAANQPPARKYVLKRVPPAAQ